ncbi:hypothetical protein ACEWY4_006807 [Coilia grayii]|uniref:WW domain binding protein VOPP1 n=1 Tax=Coilia grayii TaxID=363190 RepID=A0ABD1KEG8_9TELE
MKAVALVIITIWFNKCAADKKYCWYFEGGYPIYFICRSYEDCCDTQCCVRALSIQKIWYFWLLLLLAILLCCGVGLLFRRRIYASAIPDEAPFNVSFTRHPVTATGLPEPDLHGYSGTQGILFSPPYPGPHALHISMPYSPPPAYSSQPPPPYEQAMMDSQKK